jgi:hypothetical protein
MRGIRDAVRERVRAGGLTAAVVSVAALAMAVPALATLTGSSFESTDGNLLVDISGGKDWSNAPNLKVGLDKPTGQQDDSFGQGTKEDSPVPTVVSGSIPNNKSDLTRLYVSDENVGARHFLYLGWERVQEPNGTTNMDFEFNQSRTLSSNGVTPVRTGGDVLIKYDLSQGGTVPSFGFHRWVTTGVASQVCQASNTVPCWGKVQPLTGFADGSINTASFIDPIAPNNPRTLSPRTFGEAAIDLTASNILPPGTCAGFGRAYLKSRASDSFTAEVKDFISPIPVNINNCGTVNIHKVDDAGNALAGAAFTLYTDNAPVGGARGSEDTATSLTCTTNASGDCSIANVPIGRYWVVETTVPANHARAADQNVSIASGGQVVGLTFTDPRLHRMIVLVCHEGTDTLTAGSATLSGTTKPTITGVPSALAAKGVTQADLCGLGGAQFGGLAHGTFGPGVLIPAH